MNKVVDVYTRKTAHGVQKFIHLSRRCIHRPELLNGKFVDEYHHSHDVMMNRDKMVSRGWKLVPDPFLSLEERMLRDVTQLSQMANSGTHVVRVQEVIEMIGDYAKILEVTKDESSSRQEG